MKLTAGERGILIDSILRRIRQRLDSRPDALESRISILIVPAKSGEPKIFLKYEEEG